MRSAADMALTLASMVRSASDVCGYSIAVITFVSPSGSKSTSSTESSATGPPTGVAEHPAREVVHGGAVVRHVARGEPAPVGQVHPLEERGDHLAPAR